MKQFLISTVLALGLMSGGAIAKTIKPADGSPTGTACIVASVSGATACEGIFNGNDKAGVVDNYFGNTAGWDFLLKLDASSGTETATTGEELNVSGSSWTLSGVGAGTSLMFVLKGGPTFSAFLMGPGATSGTFDMQSALNGSGKRGPRLSHFSVYTTPAVVPLPASGLLLGLALAGVAAVRGRRKAV